MSVENAHALIQSIHPDPQKRPEYVNPIINQKLDLSIVVPVYNYVELIDANIQSILNQKTKYKFELILVDDGSTDGAREIVESYKDFPNVKVILQENQGIAGARNSGIDNSSGKYLMFVDCDDTIHDDIVESLMEKAYSSDSDIVMCAHNLSKERKGCVYSVLPNIYCDNNLMNYRNHDEIMNYAGLPWCKVYKRELWNHVRFFPGYWYEDTIIQFLLFTQCKKFSYIPEVKYEYRWYEKNFSHTQGDAKQQKSIDRYWLLLAILEQYSKLGLPYDGQFYSLLVKHLSKFYYSSIMGLDKSIIEAMFILANELLLRYKTDTNYKLPYMLRITEKAILKRDISLWMLASRFQ